MRLASESCWSLGVIRPINFIVREAVIMNDDLTETVTI